MEKFVATVLDLVPMVTFVNGRGGPDKEIMGYKVTGIHATVQFEILSLNFWMISL